MKKLFFIIVLLFAAMPLMAERVAPETAKKAAATFLNNNGAKAAQLTDLSKEAGFQHLYVFNAEQGFVVMAADDRVQPILGYSLTGSFVAEDMPTNVSGWLQGYNDEIQYAIESQVRATPETAQLWKDLVEGNSKAGLATVIVAPLIQTKWNQSKYYNRYCPVVSDGPDGHAYTGCVATAMAQIMKYWGYPAHGVGSNSYTWTNQTLSADFGATNYDWNHMALYYEYYYANGTDQYANSLPEPSAEEIAAIATLMYHCGVSVNMNYGGNSTGGSSASNNAVATALKNYFNYKSTVEYKHKSNYTDNQWIAMVKAELDNQRPLQYDGQDPNSDGGHAFVCDGYDNANYFHFNWGWAGNYNGYFSLSNLNTGANSSQAGAGNGNYTRNQSAVFGIEPATNLAAPTNLTYTLNGMQDLTLSWDAVNAAASYNVYRNGNLVGNSTTPTYSETAPFGTNDYFVRCVDANGQQSLASNTVTVVINYLTPIVNDLTATLSDNNVNLSWTAPEWCYPATETALLTYGTSTLSSNYSTDYWAHRYLASNLSQYANKAVYKVSFFAREAGTYHLHVYEGSTLSSYTNTYQPKTLKASKTIEVSDPKGWFEIDFDELIMLDGQNDLWIVINDPNNGTNGRYSAACCSYSNSDNHGNYYHAFTSGSTIGYAQINNIAWLIRTYLTDGTYTYNLYDGATKINGNTPITATNYTITTPTDNTAHLYTVKTNYYGGETNASNMAGLTLGTASLATLELAENDKMTITEGSSLTVTGTLSSSNAESLVLENGAQLVTASEDVQATVEKAITGYGGGNGKNDYTLLASPIMDDLTIADIAGMTEDNYDLYYFDQNQVKEWINYKQTDNNFTDLVNGIGYLYANSEDKTLSFAGEIHPTNADISMDLEYHEGQPFTGFNLVGNPFTCNAYIDKTDFYVISETAEGSEIMTAESAVIAPMQGLFVIAEGPNDQVVFSNEPSRQDGKSLDIRLNHADGSNLDMARIRFGEGTGLRKMLLNPDHTKVYLPKNGTNYAVAFTENNAGEMPVCFKTEHNGTYTITISSPLTSNRSPLTYLHLIDHLTGADVDLLSNPSYTFNAKSDDYASRFLLRFSDENTLPDNDSEQFAYYADGKIHVIGDYQTMEVFDLTGRALSATEHLAPGVYMVQITINQKIKTQKIIVK